MKGILDRFEKEQAVILLEDTKEELIIPSSDLPEGSKVNTYFEIKKFGDSFHLTIDEKSTDTASRKSTDLMKQLRMKKKGSKFTRK